MLDSPAPARVGNGRARFVSWWPTKYHFFSNFSVYKCQVRSSSIKALNSPLKQNAEVVVWQLDRPRVYAPVASSSPLIFSLFVSPICVRVSTTFLFALQFSVTLCFLFGLPPFFFALYVYWVPAQSEHMLDPHGLYSPVAGSSLCLYHRCSFFSL